jgi:hypothetical protein
MEPELRQSITQLADERHMSIGEAARVLLLAGLNKLDTINDAFDIIERGADIDDRLTS